MNHLRFYTLVALAMLISPTMYGQINVQDSLQTILQNDTIDVETRFRNAYILISRNSLPEEAELLCQTVVYPFVQKSWKSKSDRLSHLAELYLTIGICYRERGGDDRFEQERNTFIKAVETAKESSNDSIYSHCLYGFGLMECKRGNLQKGNEYFYQAIELYDKMGKYETSTTMLYVISLNFFQIKDVDGLQRVVTQMEPYLKKDKSKQTLYQYNVVKKMSLEILLEKTKKEGNPLDYQLVDTLLLVIRDNIFLVENFRDELYRTFLHGWAYYYLSKAFYDHYPEQTDSIFHYLNRSSELIEQDLYNRKLELSGEKELKIYIHQLRAKTLLGQGKMEEAYHFMNESLNLLKQLKGYQIFGEQYYVAYQFMADYYENINRPVEALKYYKLLKESDEQRYETEKIQAITDMSIKYETEKKEIQIATLEKEKQAAQRILWLIAGLSLALLTTFVLIFLSSRLKRKNVEQQLYETALLAELRQNELEKIHNLKQQVEQRPVKNTIEKIIWLIENSIIEKDSKKAYLERLTKIDAKLLEEAYQSAKTKITSMDMKYIVCFSADIDVQDISLIFNIEPASVHTVRYRIRKKFSKEDTFRTIL